SGPGVTSSTAANDGQYVLAVADNANLSQPFGTALGGPLFSGQEVDDTTVLVKFTWRVDLNLDGVVDGTDASIFSTNYQDQASGVWITGDVDYSGTIDGSDASIFSTNYDENLANRHLPEPGSIGLLSLGLLGLARRRRQQ